MSSIVQTAIQQLSARPEYVLCLALVVVAIGSFNVVAIHRVTIRLFSHLERTDRLAAYEKTLFVIIITCIAGFLGTIIVSGLGLALLFLRG